MRTRMVSPDKLKSQPPADTTDFASVFRAGPGLYLLLLPDSPKYTILTASDAYTAATLTKCDDLIGRGLFEAFTNDKDDLSSNSKRNDHLLTSLEIVLKELKAHEMDVQKYDVPRTEELGGGFEERYWSPLNTPIFDDDGNVKYIIHRVEDVTKKIQTERERDRFFTLGSDMLVVAGFDGYLKRVNPAWEKILGWTEEELTSQPWINFVHPDDIESTLEAGKLSRDGEPIIYFENRYRCKDGSYRWLSWKTNPFPSEQLVYGGATDITERKKTEESLIKSEQQFRQLANAMPQGVWTALPNGRIDYVNERCLEYSEVVSNEHEKYDWISLLHPDDREHTSKVWKECIEKGAPYEVNQRIYNAKSGQYRWNLTRALAVRNEKGEVTKWYGTNTDIEDQKNIEEELRQSELFAQSVIDSSPDCIKILDLQGNLMSINEGGCIQMEVDDVSMCINKPWVAFWQGAESVFAKVALEEACLGKTGRFEGFCSTMKGTPKWWEVIVAPIRNSKGKPIQILSVSRDITERKSLELANIEARETAESANLAKSEFLANMSHEIRTPMNAIIGLSNILGMSQPLTDKQKEFINTLQMSADSLLELINDLLDISKIEARSVDLENIPFDMTKLLNEAVSMMTLKAKEKGLEFSTKGECSKPLILMGDPVRLRQIILNLCSNAIKFTEKGGVYISIDSQPSENIGVQNISISVSDTGIGIQRDKQETIFQKFTQADSTINRKYGGTGLGLAITKTLTEIMGGTISLESSPGIGSTFTVRLPLTLADNHIGEKTMTQESTLVNDNSQPEHCVLLVEDYAANVLVAGMYLESFGYKYDVVDNGFEALEKAKTGDYLAILMDVQMHGMNGFETTKKIREHEEAEKKARTPIIGMTAHALMGDKQKCLSMGMDDYLSKPYNPDELKGKLASYASTKK